MTTGSNNWPHGRAERLIDAVIDGAATADEVREVDSLLQADAQLRHYYRDVSELHASLRWMHRADEPAHVFRPSPLRNGNFTDNRRQPVGVRRKFAAWTSLANRMARARFAKAAMAFGPLAIVSAAVFVHGLRRPENGQPSGGMSIIAEVNSDAGCVWSGPRTTLAVGSGLTAGERLTLEQGIARLRFRGGATVLVESPSTFELLSDKSLRLRSGTVAVRSNGPVKDFVVVSPDAAVKDLGTSFAVHCDEKSATEVEVFEGAVEVFPERDPTKGRMVEMGTNVSVDRQSESVALFASPPDNNRFASLLERLWQDIRVVTHSDEVDDKSTSVVEADFSDGPGPDAVDTFYGRTLDVVGSRRGSPPAIRRARFSATMRTSVVAIRACGPILAAPTNARSRVSTVRAASSIRKNRTSLLGGGDWREIRTTLAAVITTAWDSTAIRFSAAIRGRRTVG